jgi:hypothetical protein
MDMLSGLSVMQSRIRFLDDDWLPIDCQYPKTDHCLFAEPAC